MKIAQSQPVTAYWQPGGKVQIYLHRALPDGAKIEVHTGRRAPLDFTRSLEPPHVDIDRKCLTCNP